MKPVALVFGANSAIAQALVPHFAEHYRVIAVTRSGDHDLPPVEQQFACDYSETALAELAQTVEDDYGEVDLLFCAVGVLHRTETGSDKPQMPEKKLAELSAEQLTHYFTVNSIVPAMILKHLVPLMPRARASRVVLLSAKIAGISDNRLGGWYGYRASKAALNMLAKTASVELARSHRHLCLVALHPGTTDTPLSHPFTRSLPEDKLFSPELTAERLWGVVERLGPEDTGRFLHWDGTDLLW